MTDPLARLEQLLAEAGKTQALIDAGEARRRDQRAVCEHYEPPQAGTIDSSLYLLNLKAVQGQAMAWWLNAAPHLIAVAKVAECQRFGANSQLECSKRNGYEKSRWCPTCRALAALRAHLGETP